jgi:hypothetical protein
MVSTELLTITKDMKDQPHEMYFASFLLGVDGPDFQSVFAIPHNRLAKLDLGQNNRRRPCY